MNSAPAEILIVDDVIANLKILRDTLEDRGHTILAASDGETALRIAADATPDLILLDVMMPGTNGYEVCRRLKENTVTKHIPVIFISAREDNESVLNGFRAGGVDYVSKPFEKEEVLIRVQTHLEISRLTQEILEINRVLQKEIERRELEESKRVQAETALMEADQRLSIITKRDLQLWGIKGFIGKSEAIGKIIANVRRLQEAVKTSVLITGESGTGKELIAIAIHFGGALANGPFIPVNCSAIPDHLAESAFFGHIKGAFTGATANQKGYFEQAAGGTLFLDEIGDMPQDMQSKLLRVLEDGYVTPVGDTRKKEVAVRVIAATNQDLEKRIAEKTFRSDLYFRLAGFPIHLPPLRERKDDIPLLAAHFLTIFAAEMGLNTTPGEETVAPPQGTPDQRPDSEYASPTEDSAVSSALGPSLSNKAIAALMKYDFPGNIRELKNIIEHALIRSGGAVIQPEHLHFVDAGNGRGDHPTDIETERPASASAEFRVAESKVILRAQKRSSVNEGADQDRESVTDEERILAYLKEHSSISNTECRELLDVDRYRANYLLDKLYRYKLVVREGEFRWLRYMLADDDQRG